MQMPSGHGDPPVIPASEGRGFLILRSSWIGELAITVSVWCVCVCGMCSLCLCIICVCYVLCVYVMHLVWYGACMYIFVCVCVYGDVVCICVCMCAYMWYAW